MADLAEAAFRLRGERRGDAAHAALARAIRAERGHTLLTLGANMPTAKEEEAFAKLRANPAFAGKTDEQIKAALEAAAAKKARSKAGKEAQKKSEAKKKADASGAALGHQSDVLRSLRTSGQWWLK